MKNGRVYGYDYGHVCVRVHAHGPHGCDDAPHVYGRSWLYLVIHGHDRKPVAGQPGLLVQIRGYDIGTYRSSLSLYHFVSVLSCVVPAYLGAYPVPCAARHESRTQDVELPSL